MLRKKLVLLIGIIVISSVFIIGIYIPSKEIYERETKRYIVIDDISMKWNQPDGFNGSETFIVSGSYSNNFYSAWIQFNLTNRPDNWTNVEISLYNFDSGGEYYFNGIALDLWAYKQNWNDSMTHSEFKAVIQSVNNESSYYWRETNLGYGIRLHDELGLQRLNITYPIKDYFDKGYNGFVSLRLSGMYGDSGYCRVYSREANVNKTYLPQLIWS